MSNAIRPHPFAIPEADLDDLRQRLARTRWPDKETVDDWSQGVPLARLRALADYWRAVDPDEPTIKAARQTVHALLKAPIQRAIDAGLCRPDLQAADISLISSMLGAALRGKTREERARLAGRALQLLRGGLGGQVDGSR